VYAARAVVCGASPCSHRRRHHLPPSEHPSPAPLGFRAGCRWWATATPHAARLSPDTRSGQERATSRDSLLISTQLPYAHIQSWSRDSQGSPPEPTTALPPRRLPLHTLRSRPGGAMLRLCPYPHRLPETMPVQIRRLHEQSVRFCGPTAPRFSPHVGVRPRWRARGERTRLTRLRGLAWLHSARPARPRHTQRSPVQLPACSSCEDQPQAPIHSTAPRPPSRCRRYRQVEAPRLARHEASPQCARTRRVVTATVWRRRPQHTHAAHRFCSLRLELHSLDWRRGHGGAEQSTTAMHATKAGWRPSRSWTRSIPRAVPSTSSTRCESNQATPLSQSASFGGD
jgi:hypothetical protein